MSLLEVSSAGHHQEDNTNYIKNTNIPEVINAMLLKTSSTINVVSP